MLLAVNAFASPIFGTWKAELNGQAVTVVIANVDRHADGKMAIGAGESTRFVPISNIHFVDAPPMTVQFEVPNQAGAAKLLSSSAAKTVKFELHTDDGQSATLRVVDESGQGQTVKAVKQK